MVELNEKYIISNNISIYFGWRRGIVQSAYFGGEDVVCQKLQSTYVHSGNDEDDNDDDEDDQRSFGYIFAILALILKSQSSPQTAL